MKLSHAASKLRTAIAELTRTIGVGSGALLGVIVNNPFIIGLITAGAFALWVIMHILRNAS